MTVGVYLRMSMDRTGEEIGIDRYRAMCRAITDRHGWTSVTEYVDNDVSASKPRGPKSDYARLLADVRAGRITVVIAHDIDRLTRIPREVEDWIEMGQRGEVRLITADGEVDTFTENGRMYLRIKAAVARHEVERKGQRQRDRNQQAAEQGLPPGGRRAFGYDSTGANQVRPEAAAVKKAYATLLAGGTLSGIAADLNRAGLTTTMGGPWKHNAVRGMLINPRNAALRAHKGAVVGKATWRPIISESVYQAAVALLSDPDRKTNRRGNALSWLGTNLYLCSRCPEQTMICTYRGAKARGDQRRVYRCPACYLTRAAEAIDILIRLVVVERLRRPDLASLLAEPAPDAAPLRTEVVALRRRLDTLADNLDIDERDLARRSRKIRDRLVDLERQMAELGRGSAVGALLSAPDPGQAWLDYPDVGRRQAVIRDLGMRIRLLQAGPGRRLFSKDSVVITWDG
ncbi:recombinase family protein [Actinoplanes sichuanensis]|uniref:Recombinase family protein n=1 Tax=Actinoplanes sichuanensis TaxID=512349 RepID=A0ABW4A7B8_9ACTN|nr:recombinase family protein [Actinoplanes sichuanensis]BEL07877.1 recombinase family protein [Actinoplanes sichuanensis]